MTENVKRQPTQALCVNVEIILCVIKIINDVRCLLFLSAGYYHFI